MPEIQSFRDLDAWHAAMDLSVMVYDASTRFPSDERFGLMSQVRRASVSVPSNIAEGQSFGTDGRYMHHVRIALGSIGELSTELEIAVRLKYVRPGCPDRRRAPTTRQNPSATLWSASQHPKETTHQRPLRPPASSWHSGCSTALYLVEV